MNENTLTRPVTVHAGQLQLGGSYWLNVNSKRYDENGNVIHLNDEGLTDIRHNLFFNIRYGVLEFLEVEASIANKSESNRQQQELLLSDYDPTIEINHLTEIKGFTDLYLGTNIRLPVDYHFFDLAGTMGIFLPTAKYQPDRPLDEYNYDPQYVTLLIHNINRWGNGVPVLNYGGQIKIRAGNWGLYGSYFYRKALKEGSNINWTSNLENNQITYTSETYNYSLSGEKEFQVTAQYQAIPWLNFFASLQGIQSSNGWSEITYQKVQEPMKSFTSLNPGFEIIITSKFWLREQMMFPLGGRNDYGPFGIYLSLRYNLFPFN